MADLPTLMSMHSLMVENESLRRDLRRVYRQLKEAEDQLVHHKQSVESMLRSMRGIFKGALPDEPQSL